MEEVVRICKEKHVSLILTLIDPELPLLAAYKEKFEQAGVHVMVSDKELIDSTLDKYEFYNTFKEELPVVWTTNSKNILMRAIANDKIAFPIIAKPKGGSGSVGQQTIVTEEELNCFVPKEGYIYQPYSKAKEYGVDMYFNMYTGVLEQYFIKEKIGMRSGETDKAVSVHNEAIKDIVLSLSRRGFRGTIDMDIFLGFDGKYYVNEINPRFGGGYPHAYHCGMNFVKNAVNETAGVQEEREMDDYDDGVVMMKYNNYYYM